MDDDNYYYDKQEPHSQWTCPNYNEPVIADENGNCSLCGAELLSDPEPKDFDESDEARENDQADHDFLEQQHELEELDNDN